MISIGHGAVTKLRVKRHFGPIVRRRTDERDREEVESLLNVSVFSVSHYTLENQSPFLLA